MSTAGSLAQQAAAAPPASREEAVARARSLFGLLREGAAAAEEARHLPREMIDAVLATGLVRTLVPRRWGGTELGLTTHMEAAIELGRAYGSLGWVASFLIDHPFFVAHFPEQAQRDVWGEHGPDALVGTSFMATGRVEPAPGGHRLSGEWGWASGIAHCQWIMLGGLIGGADGAPRYHLFLVPTAELQIVDTWYSAGMRGSGSDNVIAEDVFVPEHRTLWMHEMLEGTAPGAQTLENPLYARPLMAHGGHAMVAPAIGIARGVIEAWTEQRRTKLHVHTHEQLAETFPMQAVLAESSALVDCAELLLRRALALVESPEPITLADRVRNRRDVTYASRLLVRAVNELMSMAGSSSLREESPIQRGWRDVTAIGTHVFCSFPPAAENYGRMELGLPLNPRDPFH